MKITPEPSQSLSTFVLLYGLSTKTLGQPGKKSSKKHRGSLKFISAEISYQGRCACVG